MPSNLQKKAALRVDRLVRGMGEQDQMEDSPRARASILGKQERYPMNAVAETPMRKINNARAMARDQRARKLHPDEVAD